MKAMFAVLLSGLAVAGPANPRAELSGKVKETLDAGPYTYLLISTKEGDRWAAVVKTSLGKGAKVTVAQDTVMEDFESKTLGRRFDRVVFGAVEAAPFEPVAKAAGPEGRTVAEVFAQRDKLKGKTVLVRGRVVKYNEGIMGSNWLHLRDGSGSGGGQDDDIAVTTQDAAAVGDVVVVSGSVSLDRNLGAGYLYPVLLEKARIVK